MTMPIKSPLDVKFGFNEQTVWGTAVADNAFVWELSCQPFELPVNVAMNANDTAHGTRDRIYANLSPNVSLQLTRFTLKKEFNVNEDAHLLYAFFQTSGAFEGGSAPYAKTFVRHATQPDFTTNAGHYLTFFRWDPVAPKKLKDCIVESLKFDFKPGGKLMLEAGIVARGNAVTTSPSGTWSQSARSGLALPQKFDRLRIDFGSGYVTPTTQGFSLSFNRKDLIGVGGAVSTDWQSLFTGQIVGKFDIEVVKDSNFLTVETNHPAGTPVTINIGYGNASPGTVAGDLDFVLMGMIDTPPDNTDNQAILASHFKGEILGASSAAPGATIIIADNTDRNW